MRITSILETIGKGVLMIAPQMLAKIPECLQVMCSPTLEILSYDTVIKEIVEKRPQDPSIVKGAILRQKTTQNEIKIYLIYLDKNNKPVWGSDNNHPYGSVKITRKLDSELAELFGEDDLIILE